MAKNVPMVYYRIIILLLTNLLISDLVSGSEQSDIKDLWFQNASAVLKRINLDLASRKQPIIIFDRTVIYHQYSSLRKCQIMGMHDSYSDFVDCLPDGNVVFLYRRIAQSKETKPVKPVWTQEQAIEEAKPWLVPFFGKVPTCLANPDARFVSQAIPYDGRWMVVWTRVDSSGHPFYRDSIQVVIHEKYGLISIAYNFFSTYEEPRGPLISESEALAASVQPAQYLVSAPMMTDYWGPGLSLGTASASLMVMNQNNVFKINSFQMIDSDPHARLAWRVIYKLYQGSREISTGLEVWIDAQTKEVIGGD